MHTAVNHAPEAEFSVTLSLVVTERDERNGDEPRRTERILARADLGENDTAVALPVREQSVIDRARLVLTRRAERPER